MAQDPTRLRERAAVLALVDASSSKWHLTASLIEEAGGALRLLDPGWTSSDDDELSREARLIASKVTPAQIERYERMIQDLALQGVEVVTVPDVEYPANLRDIYNRPPMLFVRGELLRRDERAIAVVGTRSPSEAGLREASRLARELAARGITVLSGLARGIDTAAHEGALSVNGRTVAVLGTGINKIYPPENEVLAGRIVERGALVSQFWPDAPPTRYSFPMRNVVMSGLALGTVVVEAGPTSGAKMQARLALEHGKRLFLVESLVFSQSWAQKYARLPGVTVVRSADEILPFVEKLTAPARELSLF